MWLWKLVKQGSTTDTVNIHIPSVCDVDYRFDLFLSKVVIMSVATSYYYHFTKSSLGYTHTIVDFEKLLA